MEALTDALIRSASAFATEMVAKIKQADTKLMAQVDAVMAAGGALEIVARFGIGSVVVTAVVRHPDGRAFELATVTRPLAGSESAH